MAFSRYSNNNIIDQKYYESFVFPDADKLAAIPTFQIVVSNFDRLDSLAGRYLGNGEYWWVIAVLNNIEWAFGFEEGQILKIPVDVQDVLRLF